MRIVDPPKPFENESYAEHRAAKPLREKSYTENDGTSFRGLPCKKRLEEQGSLQLIGNPFHLAQFSGETKQTTRLIANQGAKHAFQQWNERRLD